MRYSLRVKTEPTEWPVDRDYLFNVIKYDASNPASVTESVFVEDLIAAATKELEYFTGRAFMTQTLKMIIVPSIETVPNVSGLSYGYELLPEVIKVWRPPLQKVNGIYAFEQSGTSHTQAPSNYQVNTDIEPGEIQLVYGGWWEWFVRGYYVIDYDAGYGDTVDKVPPAIRRAIAMTAAQWYEDREQSNYTIPPTAAAVVHDYMVGNWEL